MESPEDFASPITRDPVAAFAATITRDLVAAFAATTSEPPESQGWALRLRPGLPYRGRLRGLFQNPAARLRDQGRNPAASGKWESLGAWVGIQHPIAVKVVWSQGCVHKKISASNRHPRSNLVLSIISVVRDYSDISILCISSFFKGNRFIETCKGLGCKTYLLTVESKLGEPWARDSLDDVWALKSFDDRKALEASVAWLFRDRKIDRIAPLDDFDVERAAGLREYLRVPGMGETTARYFRDKLAMRARARDRGIRIPRFVHVLNHEAIAEFLDSVPPPWMFKPRSEASAIGIRKLHDPEEAWNVIHSLGDRQPDHLIEETIPGQVFHVDSIVWNREIVFAETHGYETAPFDLMHGGGVFTTVTLERDSEISNRLLEVNRKLAAELGFVRGVLHTEFIRSETDGELYFVETAARVGGAHIAELVEASTGVNLWAEWAKIEIAQDELRYDPPDSGTRHYAALLISLARQEHPDTSAFDDPEIFWRLDKKNHVGFVLRSESLERLRSLVSEYRERLARDFQMTLPAPETATE